jgi:HAD superfamily hydrolase (TIGR01509 family)
VTHSSPRLAALVDVDGTLIDSTYPHALAWSAALRSHGHDVPTARTHRLIGMRGPRLLAELLGPDAARELAGPIGDEHAARYAELRSLVEPLPGARELLEQLTERGAATVLMSSAQPQEVERTIDMLDARDLVAAWTSARDGDESKPDPEPVRIALERSGCTSAVVIGDAPWDCRAASAAGLPCAAVLTGGYAAAELEQAGAVAIFEDPAELCRGLDRVLDAAAQAA